MNMNNINVIFRHLIEKEHLLNWDSAKVIYASTNYVNRRLVESALISSFPNINISPGSYVFNNIINKILLKKVHVR